MDRFPLRVLKKNHRWQAEDDASPDVAGDDFQMNRVCRTA
jgi:hypothetical protein